jgi:hypothetical protein
MKLNGMLKILISKKIPMILLKTWMKMILSSSLKGMNELKTWMKMNLNSSLKELMMNDC